MGHVGRSQESELSRGRTPQPRESLNPSAKRFERGCKNLGYNFNDIFFNKFKQIAINRIDIIATT